MLSIYPTPPHSTTALAGVISVNSPFTYSIIESNFYVKVIKKGNPTKGLPCIVALLSPLLTNRIGLFRLDCGICRIPSRTGP